MKYKQQKHIIRAVLMTLCVIAFGLALAQYIDTHITRSEAVPLSDNEMQAQGTMTTEQDAELSADAPMVNEDSAEANIITDNIIGLQDGTSNAIFDEGDLP